MEHAVLVVVAALALIAATNWVIVRVPIPAPVLQTALGIALAFIPGFPTVHLDPDFILLAVLPPLVYAAAVQLPWQEFVENIRTIILLAFGLVLVTVAAVSALAFWLIPGVPFAAALALGAAVSPTDPVASTALASRVGVPRRLVTILEGEGLVNDAVGLTIKAIAISALAGGRLAVSTGAATLGTIVIGEIAYGLAVAWVVARIRKRIADASTEMMVTLITPFAAYLVPAALGGSGVLATVAAGMYIGEQRPEFVPSGIRLHLTSVWKFTVYALNGTLFLLAGLQARSIWNGAVHAPAHIVGYATVISAATIVLRFGWIWAAAWVERFVFRGRRGTEAFPPDRHLSFVAWSGMRGAISLAAALSIPTSVPSRSLIVFITAWVIAVTLLIQGTTLPWLIRLLCLDRDAARETEEIGRYEADIRVDLAKTALQVLHAEQEPVANRVRNDYELIADRDGEPDSAKEIDVEVRIRRKAINAQRRRIIDLHRGCEIPEIVLRRVERDLDLQEAALENRAIDSQ